jgi:hypothetical protein
MCRCEIVMQRKMFYNIMFLYDSKNFNNFKGQFDFLKIILIYKHTFRIEDKSGKERVFGCCNIRFSTCTAFFVRPAYLAGWIGIIDFCV